jgi:hypothetical protein
MGITEYGHTNSGYGKYGNILIVLNELDNASGNLVVTSTRHEPNDLVVK